MKKVDFLTFPLFIKWYITAKCNLRCSHCYLEDYSQQEKDLDKIYSIIDFLAEKKVRSITLIGGEPLVRNDICEISKRITSRGMGLLIVTNGTLLTPELTQRLKEAKALNYQVSLEGETAELNDNIRGIGAYARAMQGVKNLIDAGMNVTLAITLTRKNHGHLLDFFKLAHSIGIKQVKLSAFIPTGTGSELNETHSLTRDINHEIANEILK